MTILEMKICSGLCLCLTLSSLALGQEGRQKGLDQSCREFVDTFYTWYLGKAVRNTGEPPSNLALKYRRYVFAKNLFLQLSEDSAAQSKAGRELVGLDFDPFLNTQDPGERYVVESVMTKKGTCLADVHGVWDGKESTTPNVQPELVLKGKQWVFVNFHYPGPSKTNPLDLLRELKELRESREQEGTADGKEP